ncbi:MAG: AAA family ATPase [Actinomycetota bacterium]|nr:AAA family ATPase [Actinomycetota bacterium]
MSWSKDQDLIDKLTAWIQAPADAETAKTNGHTSTTAAPPIKGGAASATDDAVVEKCRSAKNAAKFEALFDRGDAHAYHGGDDSVADLALLNILKFWTQDAGQLERLFSASALGRRGKWRDRHDYRRRTIGRALKDPGEVYDWPKEGSRPLVSSSSSPLVGSGDDDTSEADIVWFSELGEPKEREFLIESIGVKGYPIVAFGAGGVAKSFAMLAGGIAIASASGVERWLGFQILDHGYVLYLDFELDVEEQHRRVRDLCAGMGIPTPKKLAYLSGVGIDPEKAFMKALAFVEKYKAKAVIIDSMGLAMGGDMEKGKEVLAFHGRYINPLRKAGATPFIVDHEGKLQAGEKHKDKSPFGSAYKAWASRSVLQFQFEEYREETSELDIRVRQTKTNFGPKIDPVGVRFTFGDKKVSMGTYELPDEELLEEESRPVKERIITALAFEGATNKQLQQITGASEGTIRNKLSELRSDGLITDDGKRPATYNLVSSSPVHARGSDDDDTKFLPEERALEALREGNAPRMALANYRKGVQDFPSVVKSVLHYWHKDTGRWQDAVPNVLAALEALEEGGEGC